MGITSALVLYMVIWFLTFLVVIPVRIRTQGEAGAVVPGTHDGSPQTHHLKKKAWITTGVATLVWAVVAGVILSGAVSVRDIDLFDRMGPAADEGAG